MIKFSKLKISGFKSFVDKTELEINCGLTGIVGPNGCGKSNIVEAVKWVMGEGSAKKMRGGGMDDVIFAGTQKRTKRNIAEVTLTLDNKTMSAPPPYTNMNEIEVTRKIERGVGSTYRINGKICRARDVQLFFSDTMMGANSPALVSQGKVTEMINAKPLQRKYILEESAGVTGLYSRRHEAELKLKAAEDNLERLDDVISSLQSQQNSLKRQARQAVKYKEISQEIRRYEHLLSYMEWKQVDNHHKNAMEMFRHSEKIVSEKLSVVTQLTKTQVEQSKQLPEIRQNEAKAAAAYQAQKIMIDRLEDELERTEEQIKSSNEQLKQIIHDREYESETAIENTNLLEKLKSENEIILKEQNNETAEIEILQSSKKEKELSVKNLEKQYREIMQETADLKAKKSASEKQLADELKKLEICSINLERIEKELREKKSNSILDIKPVEIKISETETKIENSKQQIEQIEKSIPVLEEKIEYASSLIKEKHDEKSKIETEIRMLESFLAEETSGEYIKIIDNIKADSGFELALSRALGDTLNGSLDETSPICWKKIDKQNFTPPELPNNIQPIIKYIKAPQELSIALMMIGVVNSEDEGNKYHSKLATGQSLVSKNGHYWRWDGLYIKESATDRNAQQLQQKNRLEDITKKLPAICNKYEKLKDEHEKLKQILTDKKIEIRNISDEIRNNERELSLLRRKRETIKDKNTSFEKELAKLEEAYTHIKSEFERIEKSVDEKRKIMTSFDDNSIKDKNEIIEKIQINLDKAHIELREANLAIDKTLQEHNRRKARIHAIADERLNLQNRAIRAKEQLKKLDVRENQLKEKLTQIKDKPKNIKKQIETILCSISELENKKNIAAEKLAQIEVELAETNKALKQAEAELVSAREARAHSQATLEAAKKQLDDKINAINEQFECNPAQLLSNLNFLKDDNSGELAENISIEQARHKKENLIRQRDAIGPVNLMAEGELIEVEKELTTLLNEKNDLSQAIEELRSGINKLNKEARERLQRAFDLVNSHFKNLFTKLFGGGKAHLELVDSPDPLEAGLEIYAQPPGKSLQSLSLMSGGEQTLSSIALIFAMFLTNPSPICVLDEVDAPLDDANVDRICDLIEEISQTCNTRFLIITHHRLTMARMHQLYGVTMSERGVSQLVSVDFDKQLDLLEEVA